MRLNVVVLAHIYSFPPSPLPPVLSHWTSESLVSALIHSQRNCWESKAPASSGIPGWPRHCSYQPLLPGIFLSKSPQSHPQLHQSLWRGLLSKWPSPCHPARSHSGEQDDNIMRRQKPALCSFLSAHCCEHEVTGVVHFLHIRKSVIRGNGFFLFPRAWANLECCVLGSFLVWGVLFLVFFSSPSQKKTL